MNKADIILLIILGFGAIKGFRQGFIVELFSFLAFFIGLFLALEFTIPVSIYLFGASDFFEIGTIFVFLGLFVLLIFGIRLAAKGLKKAMDITVFGTLDNLAGAAAGTLKMAFIVSIVYWVFDSVGVQFMNQYIDDSSIFPYIVDIGPNVFEWLGKAIPFIRDLIDSMEDMPGSQDSILTFLI